MAVVRIVRILKSHREGGKVSQLPRSVVLEAGTSIDTTLCRVYQSNDRLAMDLDLGYTHYQGSGDDVCGEATCTNSRR